MGDLWVLYPVWKQSRESCVMTLSVFMACEFCQALLRCGNSSCLLELVRKFSPRLQQFMCWTLVKP